MNQPNVRSSTACLVIAVLTACSDRAGSRSEESAGRDSAGINIVENDAPLWTEATRWRLAERPSFEIGAAVDGDQTQQFGHVASVHRLANHTIAILDAWAPAILFYDTTGALLGRTGRRGSGPGELPTRGVLGAFTCGGDSLYVRVRQTVAVYFPPDRYVRTFLLRPPTRIRGCVTDRLLGSRASSQRRTGPGLFTDSVALVWYNLDGQVGSVLDTLPIEERNFSTGPEGCCGYFPRLFGHAQSVATMQDRIAFGFGDNFQVALRDTAQFRTIVRWAGNERIVGDAEIDRFRAFVFSPFRGNDDERIKLEQQLESARGRSIPAYGELRFDRAGNLWVRDYDQLDAVAFFDYSSLSVSMERPEFTEPRHWSVFRPDGRYLGRVMTPPYFVVHEIGENWVLGVWRDELDIQYVRQYALIKPAP